MKNTFKNIIGCGAAMLLMLSSCKKDENMVIATDGTPSVLTASNQNVVLTEATESQEAVRFSWTRADYGYTSVVKYQLQVDKKGNGFAKPATMPLSISGNKNSYEQALTVKQFNTMLAELKLPTDVASDVELRVTSRISTAVDSIFSNTPLQMKVVTYSGKPKVMYLVGGSTIADWNPDKAIQFTDLGEGKLVTYQYLIASGGGFKLLPTKGSWSGDLGMKGGEPGVLISEGEDNIPVAADGFYKIALNMQTIKTGTYTLTGTSWGVIGDATPGGWDTDTNMTYDPASKTWKVTMDLIAGKQFKFRLEDGWAINSGSATAAGDGEVALTGSLKQDGKNIGVGAGGSYTITFDAVNQTFSMVKN
ncbi:hypothetical protein C3K47_06465 [Solitalea longa]|uniref:SusE outer membrane protein domain-containing protein n=1 Tax=Solitalea longa TaxID=2079460 RepID=A0A2S5A490_9SPHI|nr:SusE domain-containing protein [Solitalea longa]POY37401.1 hypothetical protein C3K47_06465 [Solitalea longa]